MQNNPVGIRAACKTTPRRSTQRNIIWLSKNVKANNARNFRYLIDTHFPANHKLHKIFNRNTVKVSYSACSMYMKNYIKLQAPNNLKFRPIVVWSVSSTHRLSNFVDLIIKTMCQHMPRLIRDSMDFLNYLPDEIEAHTLLVSFDVVSLYTSIPHDLGLTAIEYWIDNYPISLPTILLKRIHPRGNLPCFKRKYFQLW